MCVLKMMLRCIGIPYENVIYSNSSDHSHRWGSFVRQNMPIQRGYFELLRFQRIETIEKCILPPTLSISMATSTDSPCHTCSLYVL